MKPIVPIYRVKYLMLNNIFGQKFIFRVRIIIAVIKLSTAHTNCLKYNMSATLYVHIKLPFCI